MGDPSDSIQSIMVARRLARFCPTSISVDDLKAPNIGSIAASIAESSSKSKIFLPPAPVLTTEKKIITTPTKSPKTNRFSNIVNTDTASKNSPYVSRLNYSLPNVQRVPTSKKTYRPLMVVSFSNLDLKEEAQKPDPEERFLEPTAKRVNSEDSLSSVDNM